MGSCPDPSRSGLVNFQYSPSVIRRRVGPRFERCLVALAWYCNQLFRSRLNLIGFRHAQPAPSHWHQHTVRHAGGAGGLVGERGGRWDRAGRTDRRQLPLHGLCHAADGRHADPGDGGLRPASTRRAGAGLARVLDGRLVGLRDPPLLRHRRRAGRLRPRPICRGRPPLAVVDRRRSPGLEGRLPATLGASRARPAPRGAPPGCAWLFHRPDGQRHREGRRPAAAADNDGRPPLPRRRFPVRPDLRRGPPL